ncbi:MAG: radical SAM protein [Candidatus Binataceae bacterium]|jgi:MoaA/NifB/PqqE/SkfB family radical SAM enzyme
MNSIGGVLARVPLFKLYRRVGWPQILPLNLTLSPSPKCNSRCLTCNIWMKREDELTLDEWGRVLASLGRAPYWFTISGGEPLMYSHVVELVQLAYEHCRPGVISIPTNGILPSIPDRVERIARSCPESQLIVNLSLDGIGAEHDFIRGVSGNFEKFELRLSQLLGLRGRLRNLTVGIHSVLSRFNVGRVDELIAYADRSGADQFITEIAEPRVELDTVGLPITPSPADYVKAADRIIAYANGKRFTGMAKFTEALRVEYYKLVKRILEEKDQVIDCYAGWVSAQIYADGTVWPCCVRADNLGSLRDHDYDFKKIWFGEKIKEVRRSIAAKECHCPLANASYTNMLHNIPTLARVSANILGLRVKHVSRSVSEDGGNGSDVPSERAGGAAAGAVSERSSESSALEWLNQFHHQRGKDPGYAEDALAAYALGMKAKGPILGVVAEPGPDCCEAARHLPAGKVYLPDEAPHLPLPDCPQGHHCDCVYRPAMSY